MSDYNKITNFTIKDSLPSGNTNKIIKGTELDNEFNAIQSAVSSKADANSPAFSGTPTAPTASTGTNTTQIATTAFVTTSPAFSGTPTAPTASEGTNTTQIATTAFVTTAVATAAAGVLTDGSVTNAKLATNAVTADKIASGAVTAAKLASGISGTGPVFKASKSGNQVISNVTTTKITFDTEDFDTNSNFASSTFTPTVAGYYQVNASLVWNTASAAAFAQCIIYKNGAAASIGNIPTNTSANTVSQVSDIIYCNGSSDYIEVYARQATGASLAILATHSLGGSTSFSAALVRNA